MSVYNSSGIFYPLKQYYFEPQEKNFYWGAADIACELATDETGEIHIALGQIGNSFFYKLEPVFLTKDKYKQLKIIDMSLLYDDTSKSLLKNVYFTLPQNIKTMKSNESGWISENGFYWLNGAFAKSVGGKNDEKWPKINFPKLFKRRKVGESFPISIIIQYSFDDEIIKIEKLDYNVIVGKGKFLLNF